MKQGFVYVMSNSILKNDIFKIGQTKLDPSMRANSLSRTTGVLGVFEVRYAIICIDCLLAEQTVHKRLSDYRIDTNKEFFQADFELIKSVIDDSVKQIDNDFFKKVSDNVEVISQALSDISGMVKDIQKTLISYVGFKEDVGLYSQQFKNEYNNNIIYDITDNIKQIEYIQGMKEAVYSQTEHIQYDFYDSKNEKIACEMRKAGHSLSAISRRLFKSKNGHYNNVIKSWLKKHFFNVDNLKTAKKYYYVS